MQADLTGSMRGNKSERLRHKLRESSPSPPAYLIGWCTTATPASLAARLIASTSTDQLSFSTARWRSRMAVMPWREERSGGGGRGGMVGVGEGGGFGGCMEGHKGRAVGRRAPTGG